MRLTLSESYNIQYNRPFDDSQLGDVMGMIIAEGLVDGETEARMMIQSMSREWFDLLHEESKEYKVKKLRQRGPRKGEVWAAGGAGGAGGGGKKQLGKGDSVGQAAGGNAHNMAGGGRFANNAPWRGAGADKPAGDDKKRAAKQKAQAENDRNASRGISPSERKERARQNKEKKAEKNLDGLLKTIRGK